MLMKKICRNIAVIILLLFTVSAFASPTTWPNGARLVISISMQMESGGQPPGAESPFSGAPLAKEYPDLPAESWYRYGYKEGIERMLDLWDKYNIKVTSFMVGEAVLKNPELAKDIVNRGHEPAAHGMRWADSYNMSYDQEKKFIQDGVDAIKNTTGVQPVGYNANWLRRSVNTLKVLQDLHFLYHIDDLSHDEPFITHVRGKNFVVVPYTVRNNDIVLIEGRHFSADQFLNQLKMEFDRLYAEGATKRRMMVISLHDRIGGTPAMVQAMDQFIQYAKQHQGVVFMRKSDIAKMELQDKNPLIDDSEIQYNK